MSPQNAPQHLDDKRRRAFASRRYAKTIFCTNLAASVASKKCPAALSSTLVTGATMTCGYLGGGWKFRIDAFWGCSVIGGDKFGGCHIGHDESLKCDNSI